MLAPLLAIDFVIAVYIWVVVGVAVIYWLRAFNVVSPDNRAINALGRAFAAVTEFALRPIRKMLPDLSGVDISPLVLIGVLFTFRYVLAIYVFPKLR
jgi:YggT family protein